MSGESSAPASFLDLLRREGLTDPRLLAAVAAVDRAKFVPPELVDRAWEDGPLPIGQDQTISQPSLVAWMTARLDLRPDDRVLEIGTGCGYQTAILAQLAREVYTIEVRDELAQSARERLEKMGYRHVHFKRADGSLGWPEEAPFDRILLACAPESVPQALLQQLAPGGRLIAPVGGHQQVIEIWELHSTGLTVTPSIAVRFVPMIHEQGQTVGNPHQAKKRSK